MILLPKDNIANRNPLVKSIFLAGTIDMGNSINWQDKVCKELNQVDVGDPLGRSIPNMKDRYNIFNPRRDDWDSSWTQDYENAEFNYQVNWELNAMDAADIIIMNLLPDSKSPISLLELGLHIRSGKMMVVKPNGFYRQGNIDIVCERYGVAMYNSIEQIITKLKEDDKVFRKKR